jgi:hypothetical protein
VSDDKRSDDRKAGDVTDSVMVCGMGSVGLAFAAYYAGQHGFVLVAYVFGFWTAFAMVAAVVFFIRGMSK